MLPPLELAVEVVNATGVRTRWDPNSAIAGNRPQGLSFTTKRGEGFADASVTLARRIDRDYVDLNLFDDVTFFGADDATAYEGRIAAQPRSFGEGHSISVNVAGWMAHARDQPFTEVFVDRDLSAWQSPSRARILALLAAGNGVHGFSVGRDTTNTTPALILQIDGNWVSPILPISEALYDSGTNNKCGIVYVWTNGSSGISANASFGLVIQGGDGDGAPTVSSADYWAGSDTAQYVTIGPTRFLSASFNYTITPGGTAGANFALGLRNLAVYGDHDLDLYGVDPKGVIASDVMRYIAGHYCPKLDVAGIIDTQWPIPHLVFKEPTDPYDAFLALNAFHLWEIGVWENKTLTFAPADRTDYDWEVRLSDFGVTVDLQGDTTEDLANGIIVEFANVTTGGRDIITPDTVPELADTNPDNPVNSHTLTRWAKLSLSSPATAEAAAQIGKTALAEFNSPKAPGTITIVGHLKDRAGHWQQGWKVRAGDTIAITDHPNDSPRLITETSWNQDSKQLTVTVDSAAKRLDAVLDRIGLALTAGGLT